MDEKEKQDDLRGRFYDLLLMLCKKYHLLYHMHFTAYAHEEDYIKVFEQGDGRQKMICHIHEDGEDKAEQCYRKGIEELTYYQKQREKAEAEREKNAGQAAI